MPVKKKREVPKKKPAAAKPDRVRGLYQEIFENAAIAMAVIDEDGTFVRVNARFGMISGYAHDEIVGRNWKDLVSGDIVEKIRQYTGELMKQDGTIPPTCSFDLPDKTGGTVPLLLSIRRIPGTRQVIASLTETSVQRRLEEMLRATEARYRTLVNDNPVGVYRNRLEQPGRFLWANPALIRLYGYESLAELLKTPVLQVYADPADRDRFIRELTENGEVHGFEARQKKVDGSPIWVRITARPKKSREGKTEWVEGIVEDITMERAARSADFQKQRLTTAAFYSTRGIGIVTTDCSGIITLVNPGIERMLGYTAAELVGKETPLLFMSESERDARSHLLTSRAGRLVTGFEILTWPVDQDGFEEVERVWFCKNTGDARSVRVHLTIAPLLAEDGEQLGYLFSAKEISGIRELESAFRNSCLQMSGVIYNLPDATFAIDQDGRVIAWNRAMEDSTGVKAVDILGKGDYEYSLPFYGTRRPLLIDLIGAPDEQVREWGYTAIRRKGNAVVAETPTIDPDNTLRILWGIAAPIFDSEGNRMGAIESIADVTERRKWETALEDKVLKFREILDNTGAATAIIEEDDTISFINPEVGRILGYVRSEIEGKKKWTEFVVPEDIRDLRDHFNRQLRDSDGPLSHEVRFIRWDGELRNAFLTITRIPRTTKYVVVILDITDKIRAETAVQNANRKINFLNGIIRHDILNQLTVLKGNLELTMEQTTDPREAAIVAKELAAAEAIQAYISFTRDFQDIGIEPPEWQDLRATILAASQGIRLGNVILMVEIEGVEVFSDRLLKRVFTDLVKNALDHGGKTTRIRLFCEESFEELHIICQDDGVGVPPEAKERIFNREFYIKGGLDLYLAREILSLTGIGIRETGIHGKGAEFELRVPKGGYRFRTVRG